MTAASVDTEPLPERLTQRGGSIELLTTELRHVIETAIAEHPRSLQRRLGPSEIGSPCQRKLGFKLAGVDPVPVSPWITDSGKWRPTVGVSVHAWLADVFANANTRLNPLTGRVEPPRWLVESRVDVGEVPGLGALMADGGGDGVQGSSDVYDAVTARVLDWKVVGNTTLRRAKAGHISPAYRVQAHAYGRGWVRRGYPVDEVVVVYLPAAGELEELHVWSEPYDEQVVLDALERLAGITAAVTVFGRKALPVLTTAQDYCRTCDWHDPRTDDLTVSCPGAEAQP